MIWCRLLNNACVVTHIVVYTCTCSAILSRSHDNDELSNNDDMGGALFGNFFDESFRQMEDFMNNIEGKYIGA